MSSLPRRSNLPGWKPVRLLFAFLVIILVTSLACNLPIIGESTGKRPEETKIAPTPTLSAEQVKLPPAVVETNPAPSSDLSLQGPVTFYFNQPMEKSSVEAALKSDPPVSGRFEWKDDATVQFIPDRVLTPDEPVVFTIGTEARASNGIALQKPVELAYQAAGEIKVIERLPQPDTKDLDPSSAVAVTFSQPVVPLGEGSQNAPAGFTLEPAAQGQGEWLNTRTYIFHPTPALQGGVTYTVKVNRELTSTLGAALNDPNADWSFTTALPKVLNVEPFGEVEKPVLLDDSFTVTFNQPMDRSSVEQNFHITDQQGQAVQGTFEWQENDTQVVFKPSNLLARGTQYRLQIDAQAQGLGGTPIGQNFTQPFKTVPDFAVDNINPSSSEGIDATYGYGVEMVYFTSPLRPGQNIEEMVQLQPAIDGMQVSLAYEQDGLVISGNFKPSQSYTLQISGDLEDKWGQKLGQTVSLTLQTKPAQSSLVIPMLQVAGQVIFVTPGDISISGEATNLQQVFVTAQPSNPKEYMYSVGPSMSVPAITEGTTWKQDLSLPANISTPVEIPLSENGEPLQTGVYRYMIQSPQIPAERWRGAFFLVVSRIHLTMKVAPNQLFLWAIDLETNQPVQNMAYTAYDSAGTVLGNGTTDGDGISQIEINRPAGSTEPVIVVAGSPGDENFAMVSSLWNSGANGWDFNLETNYYETTDSLYLYTDRPIYRPGQTVYYRVVGLRPADGGYAPVQGEQYSIVLNSDYDPLTGQVQTLQTTDITLSGFGTAEGEFTLPEDARAGRYTIMIQKDYASVVTFQVASYRKPEIDLQVQMSAPDFQMGQPITGTAQANYYFGGPASDVKVHWALYSRSMYFDLPGGFQVGRLDLSWMELYRHGLFWDPGQLVLEGNSTTGEDGSFSLEISPDEVAGKLPDLDLQKLTLEITLADESQQTVSARATALLHAGEFAIGVHPDSWSARVNEEQDFTVQTADWQKNPVGGKSLTATFQKVVWKQNWINWQGGQLRYEPEYTPAGSTDFQTSPDGQARIAFTPTEPGTYQLDVKGDGAVTQVLIWVAGQGVAQWPELPDQHLKLEAEQTDYQPGETARIFIPNPFGAGTPALITIERNQVMRSQVVTMNDASFLLELPLSDQDAPNIYVSVTVLGRNTNNQLDFRIGYINLNVAPVVQTLRLSLASDNQQPGPGDTVHLTLTAQDVNGQPVQGEFSLSVVDKAVLALADPNAPTIINAFYSTRPLRVQNSLDMAVYADRIVVPPLGGGGGGGAAVPPLNVRTDFQDTAYWNGTLTTGADGIAAVDVRLPDNLTTWVVTARGLTVDGRVGETTQEILVTKPFLIRPVMPRFMVVGDHVRLSAVAHNNTGQELAGEIALQASGFTLDENQPIGQPLDLAANARQEFSWWGTVDDVDTVSLTFQGGSADFSDAVTPQNGKVPVLHYVAPQTYGTAGILDQAGSVTEVVSMPRSFDPTGGGLRIEMDPSLAAAVLSGLRALTGDSRYNFTEPAVSRLLSNLATLQMITELGLQEDQLQPDLRQAIFPDLEWLQQHQNKDGGWSWAPGGESTPYLSAYVLLALDQANKSGWQNLDENISLAQNYLVATLLSPSVTSDISVLDRVSFIQYVLVQSGSSDAHPEELLSVQERLSPWAQAYLASALSIIDPNSDAVKTIISNLEGSAQRSATGASWPVGIQNWENFNSPISSTAIVVWTLAKVDPASPLLADAVRYLVAHARPQGGWYTGYQSAWVLQALTQYMKGTGELQADFSFSSSVNDTELAKGQASGVQALQTVRTSVPMDQLRSDAPNSLVFQRSEGSGRLYYRAYLDVERPVESAQPLENGISLQRQYFLASEDCTDLDCTPIDSVSLADANPVVLVRLTLTVPQDTYYLMVSDFIPAGAELVNLQLKTSQVAPLPESNPEDPFGAERSRWIFGEPIIGDQGVSWITDFVPAGTYQLTYRLTPIQAGEFKVLPARAWAFYFPEVQGTSAGSQFAITP